MAADAITRILPILQMAVDAGATVGELRTALAQLSVKDTPDLESAERQVTRTNIQLPLDGRINQTPAAFLQHRHPKEQSPGGR